MSHHALSPEQHSLLESALLQRQQSLEQELQSQLGEQGRVEHAREQLLQDGDGEQSHAADREVDLARSDAALDALRQVNEALQRLRGPDYGQCIACGEAIAFDRLMASPASLRCIDCQTEQEKSSGQQQRHSL